MSCGHAEHGVYKELVTISANMLIDDIVNTLYKERVSILAVGDERKKLFGIITRKSVINAITEIEGCQMSIFGNGLRCDAIGEPGAGGRGWKPALNV